MLMRLRLQSLTTQSQTPETGAPLPASARTLACVRERAEVCDRSLLRVSFNLKISREGFLPTAQRRVQKELNPISNKSASSSGSREDDCRRRT